MWLKETGCFIKINEISAISMGKTGNNQYSIKIFLNYGDWFLLPRKFDSEYEAQAKLNEMLDKIEIESDLRPKSRGKKPIY